MSAPKVMYCQKSEDHLVPVYFSDSRMTEDLTRLPVRQTYLGCGDTNLSSIKNCLRDKTKVSLSQDEGNSLFQIFDNGQQLSTGLNVILGERSSGKSYTLDKINREFENVRYIQQFSLVERNDKEDERKFNKFLSEEHSLLTRDYMEELQVVVNDVMDVDLKEDSKSVSDYIDSLVKYAKESERHDAFSRSKLFSEEKYQLQTQKNLIELIASTENLIENIEFKSIIEKHVSIKKLKMLIVKLMKEYSSRVRTH